MKTQHLIPIRFLFLGLVPLMCGLCNATAEQVTNEPVKIFEKAISNDQSIKVMHEVVKANQARQTNYLSTGLILVSGIADYIHVYKYSLATNSNNAGIELWRQEVFTMGEHGNNWSPIKILDLFKDKERLIVVYIEGDTTDVFTSAYEVCCSVVRSFSAGDAECKYTVLFKDDGKSRVGQGVTAANIFQNSTNGALCVKLEGVKESSGIFTITGESVK